MAAGRRSLGLLVGAGALVLAACTASRAADPPTLVPIAPLPPSTAPATTAVTTTTTAAPTTTAAAAPVVALAPTPPPRGRLVIQGTGDVNLDPTFVRSFRRMPYAEAWTGLDGLFRRDSLTVVNLECAASELGSPWNKPWTFRCDPAALPSMAAAGVDVANLANNHSMDYGFDAMLDAMDNLRAVGIEPVGTGRNRTEAYRPAMFDLDGWRVAIIGGGGVHPETGSWIATDTRPGMTDGDDTAAMVAAIRAADEVADLVIVTIHWGEQGTTRPRPFEIRQAQAFIDAGADGIFGHHQHRLQGLSWYRGRPIAWGLGNFVWQAYPSSARRTAVARFVFEPDGRIGACLLPVVIERTGHPVLQPDAQVPCAPYGPSDRRPPETVSVGRE